MVSVESSQFGACKPLCWQNSRISARFGSDGITPSLDTARPPVITANSTADSRLSPHARAVARPALKASPAPVVSTAGSRMAGTCLEDDAVTMSAPFSPSVITTCRTPARIKSRATSSGSTAASGVRPVSTLASVWFGVSTSTNCNTEADKGRTGAGFNNERDFHAKPRTTNGLIGALATVVHAITRSQDRLASAGQAFHFQGQASRVASDNRDTGDVQEKSPVFRVALVRTLNYHRSYCRLSASYAPDLFP